MNIIDDNWNLTDEEWLQRIGYFHDKYATEEVGFLFFGDDGIILGESEYGEPYAFDGESRQWKKIGIG